MTEQDWAIWKTLVNVAAERRTVTYNELALVAGVISRQVGPSLERISDYETSKHRPILTAVVVHSGKNTIPGDGFFKYAESIHAFAGRDREGFWHEELDRVYTYWEPR